MHFVIGMEEDGEGERGDGWGDDIDDFFMDSPIEKNEFLSGLMPFEWVSLSERIDGGTDTDGVYGPRYEVVHDRVYRIPDEEECRAFLEKKLSEWDFQTPFFLSVPQDVPKTLQVFQKVAPQFVQEYNQGIKPTVLQYNGSNAIKGVSMHQSLRIVSAIGLLLLCILLYMLLTE